MKRLISLVGTLLIGVAAFAQGPADALRFAQLNYEGSARSLAMGNAFTALGGDLGALAINPAASAVYRYSEMSFSLGYNSASMTSISDADLLNSQYSRKDGRMTLPNIGLVATLETGNVSGLFNFNFGFALNRIANFNSVTAGACRTANSTMLGSLAARAAGIEESVLAFDDTNNYNPYSGSNVPWAIIQAYDAYAISPITGFTNSYIGSTENIDPSDVITVGGPIDQLYFSKQRGGIYEMEMNLGGNFGDKLYLGANLNLHIVDYSVTEFYSETPVDPTQFQDGLTYFATQYYQKTEGAGVNLKVGAIYNPFPGLRLGATIQTPTVYSLTDVWNRAMKTEFDNGNDYYRESPDGAYEYDLVTPMRWSVGAAYTGERGLLSIDYENVNYAGTRLSEKGAMDTEFRTENRKMSEGFTSSHLLRIGCEYWANDRVAARMGYNLYTTPGNLLDDDLKVVYSYPASHFVSAGLGFTLDNDGDMLLDIAYQRMLNQKDTFTVYDDYDTFAAPVFNGNHRTDKVIVSFICRF